MNFKQTACFLFFITLVSVAPNMPEDLKIVNSIGIAISSFGCLVFADDLNKTS